MEELSCEPANLFEASLEAGGVAVCSGSYALTQDDIDVGKVACAPVFLSSLEILVNCHQ